MREEHRRIHRSQVVGEGYEVSGKRGSRGGESGVSKRGILNGLRKYGNGATIFKIIPEGQAAIHVFKWSPLIAIVDRAGH